MLARRGAAVAMSDVVFTNRWQLHFAKLLSLSSSPFSSSASPRKESSSSKPLPELRSSTIGCIRQFNEKVAAYPQTSLYSFLVMRMGTWYALTALFSLTLQVGPELAVGYLLAKFSGKIRQPFNISLAALISHSFPILGKIQASALLGIVSPVNEGNEATPPPTWLEKKLLVVLDWLKGPVDKYGFSLFLAGKINITLTILLTGGALRSGMDVASLLTSWGIDSSLQNGAGAMAAATLANVLLLPGHLWLLTVISPKVDEHVQVYMKKLRELEKEHRK